VDLQRRRLGLCLLHAYHLDNLWRCDIGLTAIAAVFVGGTEKGSAMNVLAGAFVLGLVNNG
jgi:ribose/xylose/arabinose/galactoside ABC-type transport system permease subunit